MMRVAVLAAGIALVAGPASSRAPTSLTERNRAVVTAFAEIFYGERDVKRAFERYVAPDYIQHNPGIADGRAAAIEALAAKFARPAARFDVRRIIVDGELAVIHLHARGSPEERGAAVADIYRLAKGRIVEHWDVLQPVPPTSANAHPMF